MSRAVRESIQFHKFPIGGINPMTAATARAFPRHVHDQYGVGVVDAGGHSSWSGRGQVEEMATSAKAVPARIPRRA